MAQKKRLNKIGDYYKLSKEALAERILSQKVEKNAILLVHNYQRLEIQHLADHVGDSLQLSQLAAKTVSPLIVFCGVHFMAESAKILNPGKKVVLPDQNAGCPMANMIDSQKLSLFKAQHPNAAVVCYVNSTAEVKAESDICCTSSNAVKVVKSLGNREILFVPDKNLAYYAKKMTDADIIPWDGHCYVHSQMTFDHVKAARIQHPKAVLVVHPECPPKVVDAADEVASTAGMLKFVEQSREKEFIIGTELGLIDQLREKYANKAFYELRKNAMCRNMKLTDLAKLAWAMDYEKWEIEVPEAIRKKAFQSLQRMVEL